MKSFSDNGFNPVLNEGARMGTEEAQRTSDEDDNALKAVLRTKQGRHTIWRILCEARVFQTTYTMPYAGAELQMAFMEGRKQVGYRLIADVQRLAPKEWERMVLENKDKSNG